MERRELEIPPGPWDDEPDRVEWRDEKTGLPCLIRRGPAGALCGYVAVPPGHPLHGREYMDDAVDDVEVHGGLTYAGACDVDNEICHVSAPGEPDDVWWFGFDCAHLHDVVPRMLAFDAHMKATHPDWPEIPEVDGWPAPSYKTIEYVRGECTHLAHQLAGVH